MTARQASEQQSLADAYLKALSLAEAEAHWLDERIYNFGLDADRATSVSGTPPKVPPPMPQHRPRHPTPPASALAAAPDSPQRAEAAEQFDSTGAGALAACPAKCPDRVGRSYCPSVRRPNRGVRGRLDCP